MTLYGRPVNGKAFTAMCCTIVGGCALAWLGWVSATTAANDAAITRHQEYIDDHEGWAQARNAVLVQAVTDGAVVRQTVQANKELSEQGFDQVIGLLLRIDQRLETVDSRVFEIQGRLRDEAK